MPIFVKDKAAEKLLDEVMALSGAKTKTAAVITALRHERDKLAKKTPPSERIKALQGRMSALGQKDPSFDMKAFSDEMSGE